MGQLADVVEGSRVLRGHGITPGRIEGHGRRGRPLCADHVLVYRNRKLAVIEAKAWDGVDMHTGREGEAAGYPTPDELWKLTFAGADQWRDRSAAVPFEGRGGFSGARYYQDIAVERVLEAVAAGR